MPAVGKPVKRINTGDAKLMFEKGLMVMKKLFSADADHPTTASLLFSKGELHRLRKDNREALKLYEEALAMRRRLFRGTHPGIADCLSAMAEIFRIENKFSQAAPMFDKALEIRTEVHIPSISLYTLYYPYVPSLTLMYSLFLLCTLYTLIYPLFPLIHPLHRPLYTPIRRHRRMMDITHLSPIRKIVSQCYTLLKEKLRMRKSTSKTLFTCVKIYWAHHTPPLPCR